MEGIVDENGSKDVVWALSGKIFLFSYSFYYTNYVLGSTLSVQLTVTPCRLQMPGGTRVNCCHLATNLGEGDGAREREKEQQGATSDDEKRPKRRQTRRLGR